MRTAYDFSPLYRSMIGVDRMASFIDTAMKSDGDTGYPPYDIEKLGDDGYRITLAVAGFSPCELEINAQPNLLVVSGRKAEADGDRAFLHRGIAGRPFQRRFELADYIVVKGAEQTNGMLSITLAREVPEALKPRRVEIQSAASGQRTDRLESQPEQLRAA